MGAQHSKQQLLRTLFNGIRASNWEEVDTLLAWIHNEQILTGGRLPNSQNHKLLHVAAQNGIPAEILDKLLPLIDTIFYMQPDTRENNGWTPLHWVSIGQDNINQDVLFLLARAYPEALQVCDTNDRTPFDLIITRHDTDEGTRATLIYQLLQILPDASTHVNGKGQNLLHRAMFNTFEGSYLIVTIILLHVRSDMASEKDECGRTPIHQALMWHTSELALWDRLMDTLAPGLENTPHPPLHWIPLARTQLAEASKDVIEELVKACPQALSMEDNCGNTPLGIFRQQWARILVPQDYAMWEEYNLTTQAAEKVVMLMTGRPCTLSDSIPSLVVLLRLHNCTSDVANFLIYKFRNQLAIPDNYGNLPLHVLAATPPKSHKEYALGLESMIKWYPEACRTMNDNGLLPLELMAQNGHSWKSGMRLVFCTNPSAVVDLGLSWYTICTILENIKGEEDTDVRFRLLREAPFLLQDTTS